MLGGGWRESGKPEPTPINQFEELAVRHRSLKISATTPRPIQNIKSVEQTFQDNSFSSLQSEEFFDTEPVAHIDDGSDKRNMAAFDLKH